MNPAEAFLAVTYRCNCKCTMCDIWNKKDHPEVEPSFYYRLPTSLKLVNLTGGEPFLRKDLPQIAEVVTERCPGVQLHLSTNGLLTERILESTKRILQVNRKTGVRISLDGIGEMHDRIRGVKGAYEKALSTMNALKRIGVRDLGFAFTMTAGNEDQLLPVYKKAREMGVDFTTAITHSSPLFFGKQNESLPDREQGKDSLARLRDLQLAGLHPKQWLRAYFTDGQIDVLNGDPRRIRCGALRDFFFLSPDGGVYPCPVLDRTVGNFASGEYDDLVAGDSGALDSVDNCKLNCWMICTARPVMRKKLSSCFLWAARQKFQKKILP